MGVYLSPDDLTPFAEIDIAKADAMIDDAEAMAVLAAPCINTDTFTQLPALRAILRGAIIRWNEAGSGASQSLTSGPFSQTVDTRQERRGMFWPSEIVQLQNLCATNQGSVYSVSVAGADGYPNYPYNGYGSSYAMNYPDWDQPG